MSRKIFTQYNCRRRQCVHYLHNDVHVDDLPAETNFQQVMKFIANPVAAGEFAVARKRRLMYDSDVLQDGSKVCARLAGEDDFSRSERAKSYRANYEEGVQEAKEEFKRSAELQRKDDTMQEVSKDDVSSNPGPDTKGE